MGNFTFCEQNKATIALFPKKNKQTKRKHQEKEINQVLKKEQIIICSSPCATKA